MINKIFNRFFIFILSCTSIPSHAISISDMRDVSKSEIALMSPVCRLIVVERPGIHHGGGDRPLADHASVFQRPEYSMAANNPHYHHYCYSELRQLRYFRAKSITERNGLYETIIKDIEYVLEHSPKDWPYFHVMLIKQATAMYYHKNYTESLKRIEMALELKEDYDRAYALKSSIHMMLNDKENALKAVLDGINKSPDSKLLQVRLSNLQGTNKSIRTEITK